MNTRSRGHDRHWGDAHAQKDKGVSAHSGGVILHGIARVDALVQRADDRRHSGRDGQSGREREQDGEGVVAELNLADGDCKQYKHRGQQRHLGESHGCDAEEKVLLDGEHGDELAEDGHADESRQAERDVRELSPPTLRLGAPRELIGAGAADERSR